MLQSGDGEQEVPKDAACRANSLTVHEEGEEGEEWEEWEEGEQEQSRRYSLTRITNLS